MQEVESGSLNRLEVAVGTCVMQRLAVYLNKAQRLEFDHDDLTNRVSLERYLQADFGTDQLSLTFIDCESKPTLFWDIKQEELIQSLAAASSNKTANGLDFLTLNLDEDFQEEI